MDEVCSLCGHDLITRRVDVTSYDDDEKRWQEVPVRCSNRTCDASEVFTFDSVTTRAQWDAEHPE